LTALLRAAAITIIIKTISTSFIKYTEERVCMSVFSSSTDNSRRVLIIASIVIGALVTDMIISSFIDVLGNFGSLTWRVVPFVIIYTIIYGVGQYLLLGFVKQVSRDLRSKKRDIDIMYRIVVIIQYVVSAILLVIILQIILSAFSYNHHYSIYLIIAATIVSYIPASIIMGLLSYRFFSWYSSNKNAISLLFLIGTSMVAINVAVGVVIHSYYLVESHKALSTTARTAGGAGATSAAADIGPQLQVNNFPKITPKSSAIVSVLYLYAFFIPLNLAYLFAWGGCTVLLRYYSKILGNVKFWIIISVPLVIFSISIYPTLLALPNGSFTFYDPNLILFRLLFRLAGTAGGVFVFCVALLTIARSIRKISQKQRDVVADYKRLQGRLALKLYRYKDSQRYNNTII
jgi:hypothetical protein